MSRSVWRRGLVTSVVPVAVVAAVAATGGLDGFHGSSTASDDRPSAGATADEVTAVDAPRSGRVPADAATSRAGAPAGDDATPGSTPPPQAPTPGDDAAGDRVLAAPISAPPAGSPADGQAGGASAGSGTDVATPAPGPEPGAAPGDAAAPNDLDTTAFIPGPISGTVRHLWAHHGAPAADDPATGTGHHLAGATTATTPHAQLQTWVDTGDDRYRLEGGRTGELVPGAEVVLALGSGTRADGFPVESVEEAVPPAPAVLDGLELGSGETLPFGALPSAVTHEVTTVLAVPAGASPDGTTATSFRNTVAGPVAGFWSSQSDGQRNVVVTAAHSWVSLSSSCHGDPFALWNEVASKVGWSSGTRRHLLVYLPTAAGCGAGLGTVGPTSESGGLMWTSHNRTDVVAHEIGHNLGLGHSNGLLCPSSADGSYSGGWSSGCAVSGYRDWYDVMGISWGNLGTLAAPHADRLGLLSSTDKVTVTTPTTVRLAPGSSDALRVARITDPGGVYYVEYRTASGQDAWLTGNWRGLNPGVVVRRVNPANSRESLLLDPTISGGSRGSDWTAALVEGDSLTTASGHARVTVRSADSAGATVDIAIGGQEPNTVSLPDGVHVALALADGATVGPGSLAVTGAGRAPEGTVLWEVRDAGDTVRASGYATTGVDGDEGPFAFAVSLPSGSYTIRVWVPNESDGETSFGAEFQDEVSLTVS